MITTPIIAIVGAPRTGKSYLAKKLSEQYNAVLFLEDDGVGYPQRMQENLAQNIRPLERQLWFRTRCTNRHIQAKQLQQQGTVSVLDIFWLSAHLYIDALLQGFERELMQDISKQDEQLLGYPDVVIYLKQSEEGTKDFVQQGGRTFDTSDTYYQEVILPAQQSHELYFHEHGHKMNLISFDRTGADFGNVETFQSLVAQIDRSLFSV